MAQKGTAIWLGKTKTKYEFKVFPRNQQLKHVKGNYIFAKLINNTWEAVYIGEGYLDERTQDPEHLECASNKGFTHYHVHSHENDITRKLEEENLIAGNIECLEENGGCNKTSDG